MPSDSLRAAQERRAALRSKPGSAGERIEVLAFDLATAGRVVSPEEVCAAIAAHKAEVLAEAAEMLRSHCPRHGDTDATFVACHCPAADAITSKEN